MAFFNKEYPKYNIEHKAWKNGLFTASVVMLFFLLFQPFGFRDKSIELKLILFPFYSFMGFVYTTSNFYIIRRIIFKSKKAWKIKNELIAFVIGMPPFALVIYFISALVSEEVLFNFYWFFILLHQVSSIIIVIIILEYFYYYNKSADVFIDKLTTQIAQYSEQAALAEKEGANEMVEISLERESMKINRYKLVFIESKGNYIELCLYGDRDELKKLTKRGRLHQAEKDLGSYPEFFRCHRAFIVNLKKAKEIIGNSKNAGIVLGNFDENIPVSRTKIKELTEKLQRIIVN